MDGLRLQHLRDWLGVLIAPFLAPACFGWVYTRRRMEVERRDRAEQDAAVPSPALATEQRTATGA